MATPIRFSAMVSRAFFADGGVFPTGGHVIRSAIPNVYYPPVACRTRFRGGTDLKRGNRSLEVDGEREGCGTR